jgi:hypothetical protein
MAATLEISYFNSFWMKAVNDGGSGGGAWDAAVVWPNGYPYNATDPISGVSAFPGSATDQTNDGTPGPYEINWFIEESRIRGGYNNTQTDLGVRAYIVEDVTSEQTRSNSMIYSGIYNSRTGINNTNQFSVGEDITKSVDLGGRRIIKKFAENTNMTIFQEKKVSSILIDKDAVYTAEGSPMQTTSNVVMGQVQPYLGEYGISRNPESFAVYGYQKYFSDKDRGVILRLSRDGITEISNYGMLDYFRDNLSSLNENNVWSFSVPIGNAQTPVLQSPIVEIYNTDVSSLFIGMQLFVNNTAFGYITNVDLGPFVTLNKTAEITISRKVSVTFSDEVFFRSIAPAKILGGYDIHNKNYVLSLQQAPTYANLLDNDYQTLAFDELINGWSSFFSYKPTQLFSLRNVFYIIKDESIWSHYSENVDRTNFYGTYGGANITFVFNQDSGINKVFKTVNYEGDNGWQVDSFVSGGTGKDIESGTALWRFLSDQTQTVESYKEGEYIENGITYHSGFDRKENKYYANLVNTSVAKPGEVVFGEKMSGIKGRFATVKFAIDTTTDYGGLKELWSVGSNVSYIR